MYHKLGSIEIAKLFIFITKEFIQEHFESIEA